MKWFESYIKYSDEELMSLIQGGDTAGLRELYKRYSSKLLFFFYRMLAGDREKSQDFLQDLFMRIIEKANQFNTNMKFSTWIYSIASNLCKNEFRSMKVRDIIKTDPAIDNYSHNCDHENKLDQKFFKEAIELEIRILEPERRETFILRFQENLSVKEISKIQACSPGTIKSRLFYITKYLAAKLNDFNPNFIEDVSYEK